MGLQSSPLPLGANLIHPGENGVQLKGSLVWQIPEGYTWYVVCLQVYNNGTQAYRDALNRSLPVLSRQACFDMFVTVDPAPYWLSPVNLSSEGRALYMGEEMSVNLTAHDDNEVDSLTISPESVLPYVHPNPLSSVCSLPCNPLRGGSPGEAACRRRALICLPRGAMFR